MDYSEDETTGVYYKIMLIQQGFLWYSHNAVILAQRWDLSTYSKATLIIYLN